MNTETAPGTAIAHVKEPTTADRMMSLIERSAADPASDPAKLKALLDVQIQIMDKQAEIDFFAAKARLKELLKDIKIVKNRSVGYDIEKGKPEKGQREAFKYVPLEDIDAVIAPLLVEVGITDSYTMDELTGGWYKTTCRLSKGTFTEVTTIPLPLDTSGGKNNVQSAGSTFSYGRRYTLCASIGLVVRGQDDDATGGPITNEQAVELDVALNESGLARDKFLKKFKVEDVRDIKTKDFINATGTITAYVNAQKRKAATGGQEVLPPEGSANA